MIPSVGSIVIVTFLNNKTGYVSTFSEIAKVLINCDEITFNDGTNKGIVKVDPLLNKINAMESEINQLKSLLSAWVPVPTDGGAALKAVIATWSAQTITPTILNDLENTKIKH